jgi:hypothetical protein
MARRWTNKEDVRVKQLADNDESIAFLARDIGRTEAAIRRRIYALGVAGSDVIKEKLYISNMDYYLSKKAKRGYWQRVWKFLTTKIRGK